MASADFRLVAPSASTGAITAEAEEIAFDSKRAVDRMVAMTEKTKEVGADTLATLDLQSEKLRRAQANVDHIEAIQEDVKPEIRSIRNVFGQIRNSLFPPRQAKVKNTTSHVDRKNEKERAKVAKQSAKAERKAARQRKTDDAHPAQGLPPELNVLSPEARQAVKDTDNGLEQIGRNLTTLKQMAVAMGGELDDQKRHLEALDQSEIVVTRKIIKNRGDLAQC